MIAPSFLFCGIDKATLALSKELEDLGGGDAQACGLDLHAFVDSQLSRNDYQVLYNYQESIGLRDISLPREYPLSKTVRYFPVTSTSSSHHPPNSTHNIERVANNLTDWIIRGFSSCAISIGMRGTGKTSAFFGNIGLDNYNQGPQYPTTGGQSYSLAGSILAQLYHTAHSMRSANGRSSMTIGLSAWILQSGTEQLVDLIAPVNHRKEEPLSFATTHCPDLTTALRVLHEARQRAPHCLPYIRVRQRDGGGGSDGEGCGNDRDMFTSGQRCHFFFRIVVHQRQHQPSSQSSRDDQGSVSFIYLADLVGLVNPEDSFHFKKLPEEERIAIRSDNLQIHNLFHVLSDMKSLCRTAVTSDQPHRPLLHQQHLSQTSVAPAVGGGGGGGGGVGPPIMKMTSARDSKLTVLLAPLLQGNVKTSLLLFLQDGERHAVDSRSLLTSLDGVVDITSACYRVKVIYFIQYTFLRPQIVHCSRNDL